MLTACFIVRAVFTTCGRNIFPSPNSLPTVFMPAISGPSMISTALGYFLSASSMSVCRWSPIPFTRACDRRSSTGVSGRVECGVWREECCAEGVFSPFAPLVSLIEFASSIIRSAAPAFLFSTTSSITSSCSFGISSYVTFVEGFTIPKSIPFWMA